MGVKSLEVLSHPFDYTGYFNEVLTKRPPIFIYLLVFAQWVMGAGKMAVRSVSPVIGAAAVFASYYLGKVLYGKTEGVMLAALLAVNPVFWFLSERVLIGVTLTFFYIVCAALFYYAVNNRGTDKAKYAWWLLGVCIGLGVMTKPQFWAVAPIFATYLLAEEGTSFLTEWREYLHMYVGAGIAAVTMLPWVLHSLQHCDLLLCNMERVLESSGATANTISEHAITQGTWYYVMNLGAILSLPVALVIYTRYTAGTALNLLVNGVKRRVKYTGIGVALAGAAAYAMKPKLVVAVALLGYAFIQSDKEERFLLYWVAWGIGLITLTPIKIPRYAVFVVPPLLLLAADTVRKAVAAWGESYNLSPRQVLIGVAAATVLLAGFSFVDGRTRIAGAASGFQQLESAGEWFQDKPDATVIASSKNQIAFFSFLQPDVVKLPRNPEEVDDLINNTRDTNTYIVADLYERTASDSVQHILKNVESRSRLQPVEIFQQDLNRDGQPDPAVVILKVGAS
jgi:4-amino-4-deoxy-L-arabinose transferase-like glycosyltransferase